MFLLVFCRVCLLLVCYRLILIRRMRLCPRFLLCLRRSCLQGWCLRRLRILLGGLRSLLRGVLCQLQPGVLLGGPSFSGRRLFPGAGPSAGGLRCAVVLRILVFQTALPCFLVLLLCENCAFCCIVQVTWDVFVFLFFNVYMVYEVTGWISLSVSMIL